MPDSTQYASSSPPFEIKTLESEDATTVALSGEFDLTSVDQLKNAIREAENRPPGSTVIDLADLSFMDSTTLAALLEARKRASENNHRLRFVPPQHEQVRQILSITGTSEVFT